MANNDNANGTGGQRRKNLKGKEYEKALRELQTKLVEMQEWVKATSAKVVVVFEGRDAAGKGGVINSIMERVSPRVFRHVALPAPTDREKTQLYSQRYMAHLPAAGEVILFDRSWYNRALVEHVMGFCTPEEYEEFLRACPSFEGLLKSNGTILIKYWFEVSEKEQRRRFLKRVSDPMRQWKLSPMDLESPSLVRLLAREGCNVRGYGYPPSPLVCLANRQQRAGQTQLHCAFAQRSTVEEDSPREDQAAETTKAARLQGT
jgi:polyphosphate kinase 2